MGISDDWGTAVIVQNMVYGNLHHGAGSGVVFTHDPDKSLDKVILWGDYTTRNQGEDVVSGLVKTYSISVKQKIAEARDQDHALEEAFSEVFSSLRNVAKGLVYEKGWSAQEIEFTFEGPTVDKLYLLQSRDMVVHQTKQYPSFVPTSGLKKALLAKGIGVSGGALCGRIVFLLDDIERFHNQEPDTALILIRSDTVPDDIREISAADGLLTGRGGATSHASIVALQLEKTCVVGCSDLVVYEKEGHGLLNGKTLRCGDFLSIDGHKGFVYEGQHEIEGGSGQ
jgi:pyruvate,orthophosphate dikinase